jgi:hypothetical protein
MQQPPPHMQQPPPHMRLPPRPNSQQPQQKVKPRATASARVGLGGVY